MEEDIKTMSSDIGKSTDKTEEVKLGDRTVINGKVHEWKDEEWKLVEE